MYKYSYRAITIDGKDKKGTNIAENPTDLIFKLKEKGLSVYAYNTVGKQLTSNFNKLKIVDLITFSTQLSQMLTAGLALGQSLQMLYERTENKKKALKKTYAFLFEEVQKGNSLSDSMEKMGDAFPQLYLSMVKSGQLSGKLDLTLVELSEHYDKTRKQERMIKSAMSYPIILLVVATLVVILLTVFVMPKIVNILPPDSTLPLPTRILMVFKNFILNYWYVLIILIITISILSKILKKNDKYMTFKGKMLLKLPKIGRLNAMRYTAQFAGSLSTLYSVGVNLLDAISMSGEVVTNAHIRHQINKAVIDIKKGSSISEAFSNIEGFDPLLTTMIFVGEQSGSLGVILKKTAVYFDEEAETAVKGLIGLIQPVMLIVMAVVIGFVMMGVLSPMFQFYKTAAKS